MKFWKMNGAGNDFLILNNLEEQLPHEAFPAIARTLCERHLSIGADGLMVNILKRKKKDEHGDKLEGSSMTHILNNWPLFEKQR